MKNMISTQEALQEIRDHVCPLPPVLVPLAQLSGQPVLAEDVLSPIDIPSFPQSAMDGFAFRHADWTMGQALQIAGEVAAGDGLAQLGAGQCMRIFTGAPVPAGADTVAQKEIVRVDGDQILIEKDNLVAGSNVRLQGAEIKTGAGALPAGTQLAPGAIGFLANLGVAEAPIVPTPTVSLIVTGNELVQPGQPLSFGQVYESNSYAVQAALANLHIHATPTVFAKDTLEATVQCLQQALEASDVVLLTGGISAGDYDFVLPAALQCGVVPIFHKVRQRPGKPLFFGVFGPKIVFGLPGNPASVLTCFYAYVRPALLKMMGKTQEPNPICQLEGTYKKAKGLAHFLKAVRAGDNVRLLGAQESFRMSSFALANCLVVVPEETELLSGNVEVLTF
jgi:molybdopterin molybdotransferase